MTTTGACLAVWYRSDVRRNPLRC